MLTEKQKAEIREHLHSAQNPLFFFDNDNDGLTSFLILRRYIGRGKGVAIKSYPELHSSYFRKVKELNPDYVFILDKPDVSEEFLEKIAERNIPIVWIDHHISEKKEYKNVNYYNPYFNDKHVCEPVSYICYKIVNIKRDSWIAIIGCISDCFMPDFYDEFFARYPELGKKNPKSAFDLLYKSEIGKIARILDFSLKDTTTNVVRMFKFMMNVKNPRDILEENYNTRQIHKRFNQINSKYQDLLKKARSLVKDKILYFQYGGKLSLSSNLANQLIFEFPDKVIVVVYLKGDVANVSFRGKDNVRNLTLEAIKDIPSAMGGGHEHATGAKMSVTDLPEFKDKIISLIEKD